MAEFTKGEWKVSGIYVISKQNEEDYIRICKNLSSDADACLIAAAPETKQQRDDLLDACKDSPTANMFSLFADFAEECFTKPSMAVYRNKFNGLATFLRSCEKRAEDIEAAIGKV